MAILGISLYDLMSEHVVLDLLVADTTFRSHKCVRVKIVRLREYFM